MYAIRSYYGQYKLSFVGKDQRGQEVKASAVAWVAGPGFHGRDYRFQGLELRTALEWSWDLLTEEDQRALVERNNFV